MRSVLALLFALLASPALAQPADLVLRGGHVITVDKDWRVAQAVAIRDGRFVAVGDDEAMGGHIGPNTQRDRARRQDGRTGADRLASASAFRRAERSGRAAARRAHRRGRAGRDRRARRTHRARQMGDRLIGLARKHPGRRPDADALRTRRRLAEQPGVHSARRPCRHGELARRWSWPASPRTRRTRTAA